MHAVGDDRPLLGVTFDSCLSMKHAVYELAGVGHSRVTAILRLRRFHSIASVVGFYKAQVLGKLEFATPAIYHATDFILAALDRVQDRFLDAVGLSQVSALLEFKLAPLRSRRDIALLGFLHRIVLGKAPKQFSDIVHFASCPGFPRSFRDPARLHDRQLRDPFCGSESRMLQRSWLRLIYTYNLLPQAVVDHTSVSAFQKQLQIAVQNAARSEMSSWSSILRDGVRLMSVSSFQALFQDR